LKGFPVQGKIKKEISQDAQDFLTSTKFMFLQEFADESFADFRTWQDTAIYLI
jgi:hypothetical protein